MTEAWATVTATDNASLITGEHDAEILSRLFSFKMRKKQLSTGFQISIPRRRIQGDPFLLDPVSHI